MKYNPLLLMLATVGIALLLVFSPSLLSWLFLVLAGLFAFGCLRGADEGVKRKPLLLMFAVFGLLFLANNLLARFHSWIPIGSKVFMIPRIWTVTASNRFHRFPNGSVEPAVQLSPGATPLILLWNSGDPQGGMWVPQRFLEWDEPGYVLHGRDKISADWKRLNTRQ